MSISNKPTIVETRAARHVVYIQDIGFRYVTTRGCADYEREFTSHTNFASQASGMNNTEEMEEPQEAEFIDCPSPFPYLGKAKPKSPPDYGLPYNPGDPLIIPPDGSGEQE